MVQNKISLTTYYTDGADAILAQPPSVLSALSVVPFTFISIKCSFPNRVAA